MFVKIPAQGHECGESLVGTSNPEKIYGKRGDDTRRRRHRLPLRRAGDDVLSGGDGDDRLVGGSGDDTIDGGAGQDRIYGGGGNDTITAGDGESDVVNCGGGYDTVLSHDPSDILIKCEEVLSKDWLRDSRSAVIGLPATPSRF